MKNSARMFKLIIFMLLLASCNTPLQESVPTTISTEIDKISLEKFKLVITGDNTEFSLSAKEITDMTPETMSVSCITSSGEIITGDITGVKLDILLQPYNIEQRNYNEIRLFAADGYSIIVPAEIVKSKDIYIIWEYNNEPLQELHYPIRAAIADERSMYWVYQLSGIELIKDEMSISEDDDMPAISTRKIVFMETAITLLESLDYTYNDSVDKAVSVDSLLTRFNLSVNSNGVTMHAMDNFDKAEKLDIFKKGYIKYTGEDSPIFIAPDMPKGMQVKHILWLKNGDTVYLNERMAYDKYKNVLTTSLNMKSVPIAEIEKLLNLLESKHYMLVASDGHIEKIDRETFLTAELFMDEAGLYVISYKGMEKLQTIKNVISIEISE
ncbi:MAG: molybdopterin-dependent oxidoreductase [Dethiosulfatibacter sp.]|nr:molybdopterin-dependent oxidoreductase [Dethiosulfatibacter sp.]